MIVLNKAVRRPIRDIHAEIVVEATCSRATGSRLRKSLSPALLLFRASLLIGVWYHRTGAIVATRIEILLVELKVPPLSEMPLTDTGGAIAVLTQEYRYSKTICGDQRRPVKANNAFLQG